MGTRADVHVTLGRLGEKARAVASACLVACLLAMAALPSAAAPGEAAPPSPVPSGTSPRQQTSPVPSPAPAAPDEPLSVNPYGPTVTNPATLTNIGVPEYEVFYFRQGGSPSQSSQIQTPLLVKYTWAGQWQISVGTSGYTQIRPSPSDPTATALGDPNVTLKYLFLPPSKGRSAQAIELTYGVPVSPAALGVSTGRPSTTLTWLYSRDLGSSVHTDANLWGVLLTDSQAVSRFQLSQSMDLSWEFVKGWTYTMDFHHFGPAGPQFRDVWAVQHFIGYSVSPAVNLSAGVEFGLNQAAPHRTYMAGIVFLIDHGRGARGK